MTKSIVFFRNWYELAEGQSDDARRLAYYDSIFRYGFDGAVPHNPGVKGKGPDRAAYFAYLTVQPVLEAVSARSESARKAANARFKNAAHNAAHSDGEDAPHNAPHSDAEDASHYAPHDSPYKSDSNMNMNMKVKTTSTADDAAEDASHETEVNGECHFHVTLAQASAIGKTADVPEEFTARVWSDLSAVDGDDGNGGKVKSFARYLKAAWNHEKNARPSDAVSPAPSAGDESHRPSSTLTEIS